MNKMAQTLTNPVATNLVPLGKSLVTVREGISPHSVVEDNTFLCLTHKKCTDKNKSHLQCPLLVEFTRTGADGA